MVQRAAAGPPCAAAVPLAALAGTELAGFAGATPCGVLHPHESCNRHMLSFLPTAYLRALPVYFPGKARRRGSAGEGSSSVYCASLMPLLSACRGALCSV